MIKLNFKNIAIVASSAILSFSSCEKESDWDADEDVILLDRFYAVMNDDSQDGLKSYQQGCYGIHEIHNKWNDGDIAHLLSFVKGNGGLNYWGHADYVRDGFIDNYATFVPVSTAVEYKTNGNGNGNSNSYSYIAAAHNATWPENPNKGKFNIQANFEVKSSQTYNDSIVNGMPMIALSGPFGVNGGDNFQNPQLVPFHFENLASIIRFDVTPDHDNHDKHITNITVTGNNICGSGQVTIGDSLDYTYVWNGGGDKIELTCGNGTERNGVLSYVMIVPELTNVPLTITITANNGKTKTLSGNATIPRSTFKKVAINLAEKDFASDDEIATLDRFYAVVDGDSENGLKSYQQGCYGIHDIHNKWNDGDIAHLLSFVKGNGGLNYWGHADYVRDGFIDNYATFVPVSTAVEYKTNGNGNGNSNSYSYIAAAHNATWPENPNKGKFNIQANFEVKSSQTFNDSIVNSMPMIALSGPFGKNGGDNFQDPKLVPFHFQNLASIIRFDVTPDHNDHDKHITNITVTGNNICGSGNVIYEETKLDLKYNWTGGGNTISLDCKSAHEINGVKSYTMIVPPLNNVALTIVITASNGKTKTLKGNATIARSAFKKVAVDLSDPDFQ